MNSSIWLIAIPDEFAVQKRIDLRILMRRALRVEERMIKGVQIEDEQRRYHVLCDRIEYLGNLIAADCPVISMELSCEYLEFLFEVSSKNPEAAKRSRLFSNFCPADLVATQLVDFLEIATWPGMMAKMDVQKKIAFYEEAIKNQWSVLELVCQRANNREMDLVDADEELRQSFLKLKVDDSISRGENSGPFIQLRNQIEKSVSLLRQGMNASIDFSDLRHDVITEILHDFVYKTGRPTYLPVVYGDGSKAAPFPIFCLRNRSIMAERELGELPVLNVGMMSARHHELDNRVKVYWFRNQEISIGRTMGESDKVAYEKTKELLEKTRTEGIYKIGFYQTGFQPAVVGFYRALTEELIYRAKMSVSFEVIPFYFLGGEYRQGKIWC